MIKKKANKKGFTIMEMLIVVAIIAVLAAIAIPTFNGALTKSKEAADVANIRAAYAEMQVAILTDDAAVPTTPNTLTVAKAATGENAKAILNYVDGTLNYGDNLKEMYNSSKKVYTIKYTPKKLTGGNDTADAESGYQKAYVWTVESPEIK